MIKIISHIFGRAHDDTGARPWANVPKDLPHLPEPEVGKPSDTFLDDDELSTMPYDELLGEHRGIVSVKVDLQCELEKLLSYERIVQGHILRRTREKMAAYGIVIAGRIAGVEDDVDNTARIDAG